MSTGALRTSVHVVGLAIGLALVGIGVVLAANPWRLVVAYEHETASFLSVAVGLVVLAAVVASRRRRRWQLPLAVTLAVVALVTACLAFVPSPFGPSVFGERVTARSDDGRLRVVHVETSNVIDPVDRILLRSDTGALSRQDEVGCFNADASSRSFTRARFLGDGRLEVVAGGEPAERWVLRFDPESVEMLDTLPDDVC